MTVWGSQGVGWLSRAGLPSNHTLTVQGEWEITYRWTMAMRLGSKASEKAGPPKLAFTGTSIMGINPSTGKQSSRVHRLPPYRLFIVVAGTQ